MNPLQIITLVETVFTLLENVVKELVNSGVIAANHPTVQQTASAKKDVTAAKTASANG